MRLEYGDDPRVAATRARDIEGRARAPAWQARPFRLQQLAVEHQMCGEPRALLRMRQNDRSPPLPLPLPLPTVLRNKALHARHELVGQLAVDPSAPRL